MTRMYKRERNLYIFAGVVTAIAVINVLFFFILYRPAQAEYSRLQDSIGKVRAEVAGLQIKIKQKEKSVSQLETSNQDRQALFTSHLIPLNTGFAKVVPELDQLAQKAGVRWSRGDSDRDAAPEHGLYSVKIRFPVQGSYSSIVNFIRNMEDAGTMYIITSIDVRSTAENGSLPAAGNVALSLGLETYFYQ